MALISSKDAAGTVMGQTTYSYDDASRLIGIETPTSSKWQFVYDGMSRLRISRSWIWQNGVWVQNSEKGRVYLGMDVVQERDAGNLVTASYTRTGNIGGLLARSTSTGNVFYGYDGGGNVTSLTDSTGATVGTYTYDAWGNLLNSSGAQANDNPFRFSTKEQLAGLTFYGYRFYSTGLGRWINRDPIREQGGVNLYEFVNGSPTNQADLYGNISIACVSALAGLAASLVGLAAAIAGGEFGPVEWLLIVAAIAWVVSEALGVASSCGGPAPTPSVTTSGSGSGCSCNCNKLTPELKKRIDDEIKRRLDEELKRRRERDPNSYPHPPVNGPGGYPQQWNPGLNNGQGGYEPYVNPNQPGGGP